MVSTLPADYCTVIAPEEQLTHAEMLHELRESGRGEDSACARWSLADHHVQARFHVVHRNRWAAPEAGHAWAVRTHKPPRGCLRLAPHTRPRGRPAPTLATQP